MNTKVRNLLLALAIAGLSTQLSGGLAAAAAGGAAGGYILAEEGYEARSPITEGEDDD